MKSLVTGGTGFIGANVVRALLEQGHAVRVLVRPASDGSSLAGLPIETTVGDVCDAGAVRAAVRGCEAVFHVAARYVFGGVPAEAIYEANVEGTRIVLQAAWDEGIERVVHTSSVAALGWRRDGQPADETTRVDFHRVAGHYKRSKLLAQAVALEFARRGLPVVVVSPSFPVGPYDVKPTPTGQVIVDFLHRRMPAYVQTGMNVVAVEDVARGHILACEKGRAGEIYILGGENLTMKQLLELLAEVSGLPAPRMCLPAAPLLPLSYGTLALGALTRRTPRLTPDTIRMARHPMYFDPAKAIGELGLPQTPAREALCRAVSWFRSREEGG